MQAILERSKGESMTPISIIRNLLSKTARALLFLWIVFVSGSAVSAYAQADTATVQGRLVNTTGSPVSVSPEVTVLAQVDGRIILLTLKRGRMARNSRNSNWASRGPRMH